MNPPRPYRLTGLEPGDVSRLLSWFNDTELCRFMEDSDPGHAYTESDFKDMARQPDRYLAFRHGERIIGYASIYAIDRKCQRAEFSFLIGDPEYRGRGLSLLLLEKIRSRARESGISLLYCSVHPENRPSIRALRSAGFSPVSPPEGGDRDELYFEIPTNHSK
jgi:RimJ/RimL family protein N-acetyltransferase